MVINIKSVSENCESELSSFHQDLITSEPSIILPALEKIKQVAIKGSNEDIEAITKVVLSALLNRDTKPHLRQKFIRTLSDLQKQNALYYTAGINDVISRKLDSEDPIGAVSLILQCHESPALFSSSDFNLEKANLELDLFRVIHQKGEMLWALVSSNEVTSSEKNLFFSHLHLLVKCDYAIIQQGCQKPKSTTSVCLLKQALLICSSTDIPLDLRNACGLLVVKLCIVNGWKMSNLMSYLSAREVYFQEINNLGILAIFHGVLCNGTPEEIVSVKDSFDILEYMFQVSFASIKSTDNTEIILACRVINHVLFKLLATVENPDVHLHSRYEVNSGFSNEMIDAIWLLWDHFLDGAKHMARDIFLNFIKFHVLYDEVEAQQYFSTLAFSLLEDLDTKKYTFSALSFLVPLVGASCLLSKKTDLPVKLVLCLSDSTYATHALTLLQALFEKHNKEVSSSLWIDTWFPAFFENYEESMLPYGYESLLKKLLLCKDTYAPLAIEKLGNSDDMTRKKQNLLIMCAKTVLKNRNESKKKPLPSRFSEKKDSLWRQLIPLKLLSSILFVDDDSTSMLAFNLVCENTKSTELFDKSELNLIASFIDVNVAKSNPSFQQKLANNFKKVLCRINAGLLQKAKHAKSLKTSYGVDDLISGHQKFLQNTYVTLMKNLHCGANHPRRITSLSLLKLFVEIPLGKNGCVEHLKSEFFTAASVDTLLLGINDTYETNKVTICPLLQSAMSCHKPSEDCVRNLIQNVWTYASSCKPADSITASYLLNALVDNSFSVHTSEDIPENLDSKILIAGWCVLDRLKNELKSARVSIFKAATCTPMYGLLQCLRQLIARLKKSHIQADVETWKTLVSSLLATCYDVIKTVEPVVNNDSPEGHLPMDFCRENLQLMKDIIEKSFVGQELLKQEMVPDSCLSEAELVKAQAVTSQMLLLCGWRSIKEASLVLSELVKLVSLGALSGIITKQQIEQIGNVFLDLLINTKHRGAFEQANVGFNLVCSTLWNVDIAEIADLPDIWLQETLTAVEDIEHPRLCATRRSAGLPFIIQSILGTEPNTRASKSLKFAVQRLFHYSHGTAEEAKVHSLNILRFLFRDARLADDMIVYVSEGVQIALSGYKSQSWAERNAATLLLSALINRMIGIKRTHDDIHSKNSMSALVYFTRFPKLNDVFLQELRQSIDVQTKGHLSLATYPVLMILARLAPISSEGRSSSVSLTEFVPLILACSGSPIYQLRVLASKAIIPLLTPSVLQKTVIELCQLVSCKSQNQLHGILLCLKQIIINFKEPLRGKSKIIDSIVTISWVARDSNKCMVSRAAAIDMFVILLKEKLVQDHCLLSMLSSSCLSLLLSIGRHNQHEVGALLALQSSATFLLVTNKNVNDINTYTLLLESPLEEAKMFGLEFVVGLPTLPPMLANYLSQKLLTLKNIKLKMHIYAILAKAFGQSQLENVIGGQELEELLQVAMVDLQTEGYEDSFPPIIKATGHILKKDLKNQSDNPSDVLVKWMGLMEMFTDPEYSVAIREAVADTLAIVAPECHQFPQDDIHINILRIFIDLVTDDELDVRNVASEAASSFLASAPTPQNLPAKQGIQSRLISYLASKKPAKSISTLLHIALKEEPLDEFGLSQDKDRAFEKSETNIYRERIDLAHMCSVSMAKMAAANPCVPTMDFEEEFLVPIAQGLRKPDHQIDMKGLAQTLATDIEYILEKMSPLDHSSAYNLASFEQCYNRLGVRAHLFNAVKHLSSTVISANRLTPLTNTLLKTSHMNSILAMLSK